MMDDMAMHQLIYDEASKIGEALVELYPPNTKMLVPAQHTPAIADQITYLVAEILQSYLDAGSERENTMEELGPVIEAHVKGWDDSPENGPVT